MRQVNSRPGQSYHIIKAEVLVEWLSTEELKAVAYKTHVLYRAMYNFKLNSATTSVH